MGTQMLTVIAQQVALQVRRDLAGIAATSVRGFVPGRIMSDLVGWAA